MHWDHQSARWPMLAMFDLTFLSIELGLVKPDMEIFQAVADQLPVGRERVLYLDDVALNADAARTFGFRSEPVCGPGEFRKVLTEVGLLDG